MSPVGKTKDAGWEIGVSRTVHHPRERVWEVLTSTDGTAIWLGAGTVLPMEPGVPYETVDGTVGEVRSFRPLERVRLTWQPPGWDHDATLQVAISPTTTGTKIVLHQDRLADGDERERQRQHWVAVMDQLVSLLDA